MADNDNTRDWSVDSGSISPRQRAGEVAFSPVNLDVAAHAPVIRNDTRSLYGTLGNLSRDSDPVDHARPSASTPLSHSGGPARVVGLVNHQPLQSCQPQMIPTGIAVTDSEVLA